MYTRQSLLTRMEVSSAVICPFYLHGVSLYQHSTFLKDKMTTADATEESMSKWSHLALLYLAGPWKIPSSLHVTCHLALLALSHHGNCPMMASACLQQLTEVIRLLKRG